MCGGGGELCTIFLLDVGGFDLPMKIPSAQPAKI